MKEDDNAALVYLVGDVTPNREDPSTLFVDVTEEIRTADIAFCQLELAITERGQKMPQARKATRTKPAAAAALRNAGFNLVSFATNHCMDWGPDGLFDTMDALTAHDIKVFGVGRNLATAREPVFFETGGGRIAFLSYNSILPMGYWAEDDRPGAAPMRAWTHYEQVEHDQPGTPARIHTFANCEDLRNLVSDIREAKSKADVVVLSMHWGIHFIPAVIADYQREVAEAAIDAGADLVFGHHAHILKGVDFYKGVPILYSLGNFAVDLPFTKELLHSKRFREIQKLNPDWQPNLEWTYNYPPDSRRTFMVKLIVRDGKIDRLTLVPCYINTQSQPSILDRDDPRFIEVVNYVREITESEGLCAKIELSDGEVTLREIDPPEKD